MGSICFESASIITIRMLLNEKEFKKSDDDTLLTNLVSDNNSEISL